MATASNIVGLEWYNQNSLRKYPIADDATATTAGGFELPNDFIVDLVLPISASLDVDPDNFFISEVAVFGQGVVITVSYSTTEVGRVSVSATHQENASYFIHGTGTFEGTVGKITIGKLDSILEVAGVFSFSREETKLVSSVVRPNIRGVSSISVANGDDVSDPLTGSVLLVAGQNMTIDVNASTNQITLNAVSGAGLSESCGECEDATDRELPDPIRTINGVGPVSGNLVLAGGNACVDITSGPGDAALSITDTCSVPCCDMAELQAIIDDMDGLQTEVRTQHFTMEELENRLTQLEILAKAIEATGINL